MRSLHASRPPWVRGSPADEWVVPKIAVSRVAGGKTVVRHAEPCVVGRSPNRIQVRMVDGNAFSQIGIDACGPWRARPCFDFLRRCLDRSTAHNDERLQAVGVLAAKVMGKTVIGSDKSDLNLHVVRRRR